MTRLPVLDGWRATSILLVLCAHWFPVDWLLPGLNYTAGAAGMALFFNLSGFLILSFLLGGEPLGRFVIKRITRIVPVAWLAVFILAAFGTYSAIDITRNLLFVANLPPASLLKGGEHLWSLGVEMQFYAAAALICILAGRKGLYIVPLAALAVTAARVVAGEPISIVTWHRVDEILAGGSLALLFRHGRHVLLNRLPFILYALFFFACCHPWSGPLQYLRPYAGMLLIGSTLSSMPKLVETLLVNRLMRYVAEVSYAVYVFHGMLVHTWLGTGSRVEMGLKRPLLVAATFAAAHLSTRYFERPVMRFALNLYGRSPVQHPPTPAA